MRTEDEQRFWDRLYETLSRERPNLSPDEVGIICDRALVARGNPERALNRISRNDFESLHQVNRRYLHLRGEIARASKTLARANTELDLFKPTSDGLAILCETVRTTLISLRHEVEALASIDDQMVSLIQRPTMEAMALAMRTSRTPWIAIRQIFKDATGLDLRELATAEFWSDERGIMLPSEVDSEDSDSRRRLRAILRTGLYGEALKDATNR